MSILYIIIAVLFFGVLIAIHEFGHFAVAKLSKVRVEEYAIGMGPAIFKKQWGETTYSLRCIPIGGYCAMTGEDGESEDARAFSNAKLWRKLLILVAGSAMNFLLGFLIVVLLYSDAAAFHAPVLEGFMTGCPYESADGLQQGDRFYSIDGHRIYQYSDVGDYLSRGDGCYDLVVLRDGKRVTLKDFTLVRLEYEGYSNKMYGFYFGYDEATPVNVVKHAWWTSLEFARWVWEGLEELVRGKVGVNDMSGVVGIVDMMAETGEQAATTADAVFDIAYMGAFIAVNLAVMNMLPIPALDGGRVFLLLVRAAIEAITRKKLNPKYEAYIHAAGMVLLLTLMAYVMFHDIYKIVVR